MKTPKTNRSPTKMSPSSGYSPRSFRAKGTETSPTTLASSGMSSITAWDRDERPRFENGMDMTSLEYGKVGKMIYVRFFWHSLSASLLLTLFVDRISIRYMSCTSPPRSSENVTDLILQY